MIQNVGFCVLFFRHITDPRFSRPLLTVGDIVLGEFHTAREQMRMKKWISAAETLLFACVCVDLYQQVIPQSPVVERLLQRLYEILGREAELQQELLQVLGILDTLFASLMPRKEVANFGVAAAAQESQLQAAWGRVWFRDTNRNFLDLERENGRKQVWDGAVAK